MKINDQFTWIFPWLVMPAQAGTHPIRPTWTPACADMTDST